MHQAPSSLRRLGAGLLLLGFSAGLSFVGGETLIRLGGLFREQRDAVLKPGPLEGGEAEPVLRAFPHPYTGWSMRPDNPPWALTEFRKGIFPNGEPTAWFLANRGPSLFGFRSAVYDYRELPDEDLVIGVFGGSVAAQLAMIGGDAIVGQIESRHPALSGSVRVLNFGEGAFKQPQQLMVLTEMILLGVPFDFVVNLDGFNEVTIGAKDATEGYHPILPSRSHYLGVVKASTGALSPREIELTAEILRCRRGINEWIAALHERPWIRRSALAQAVTGTLVTRLRHRARQLEAELQEAPGGEDVVAPIPDPCLGASESSDRCQELIGGIWRDSSLAMAALARQAGAAYLHYLQPNQYVPESKPLSEEERKLAYKEKSQFARAVRAGYPVLLRQGEELRRQHVDFRDLTMIFQGRQETIYRDVCCHFNWQGNQAIGEEIGRRIAEEITQRRRDGNPAG